MLRALRIGLFIGTFIGMSACAGVERGPESGVYGSADAGVKR